jgi:DNA-binding NarL/FixJ family response regulator
MVMRSAWTFTGAGASVVRVSGPGRARVVIADDHPAVAARLSSLLSEEFTVAATVSDGVQLLDAVATLQPDVLVVDLCMRTMTGVEATAQIRRRGSRIPIVWVSSSEPDLLDTARDLGVLGYVNKKSLFADLVPAVRAALDGQTFMSVSRSVGPPQG